MKKKLILILLLLVLAVPVAAQETWQGYVLIDISTLNITEIQVIEALAHYSRLEGEYPDELLQVRWALSPNLLIAEALWDVSPTEENIELAFAGLTGLDVLEVQPYVTVTVFASPQDVRSYLIANISLWELPE
jgi:hypothetical protein